MEEYEGQLQLEGNGPVNLGALTCLVNHVRTVARKATLYPEEDEDTKFRMMEIGFRKITPAYNVRMKTSNFQVDSRIGYGAFGSVWKVTGKDPGPTGEFAMKKIDLALSEIPDVWKERDLLVYLKHERISQIVGSFYESDVFFVMELCYGSVARLRDRIDDRNAFRFSYHLLEAVEWIHSKGIIHADIKPDNCLINRSNNLVLSDFGSAVILPKGANSVSVKREKGSPGYLNLPALRFLQFSMNTDVFGCACVIFEMTTGAYLLYNPNSDQTRQYYVDALTNGRKTQDGQGKQLITERVEHSTLKTLLLKMISFEDPISARDALSFEPFLEVLKKKINFPEDVIKRVCDKEGFVTKEYSEDRKAKFTVTDMDFEKVDPSLFPLYYDSADELQDLNERPQRNKPSYPINKTGSLLPSAVTYPGVVDPVYSNDDSSISDEDSNSTIMPSKKRKL